MIYFLFGTLWSILFWVVYITLSLFVTIRLFKMIPEKEELPIYNYITQNGKYYKKGDTTAYIIITLLVLLFWPIIVLILSAFGLFPKIIWPVIRKAMTSLDKAAPTITFGKKKEEPKNH